MGQLFPDIQREITTQLVDKGVITTAQLKGYEARPCDFLQNIKEVEEHCDNAGTSLNQVGYACIHGADQKHIKRLHAYTDIPFNSFDAEFISLGLFSCGSLKHIVDPGLSGLYAHISTQM